MNALASNDQIQNVISDVLSERFPKTRIISINIRNRTNEDGDQQVDVGIVFEATKEEFEAKKIPAFLSEVVRRLNEIEETRFPIISFIAKSDLRNRKPEAA